MATKTAKDYDVSFGYKKNNPIGRWPSGATKYEFYGPFKQTINYIGPYHRGEDQKMPVGIRVVINNTLVGLSGASGNVSGPHVHGEKWTTLMRNWWRGKVNFKPVDLYNIKRGGRVVYAGWAQGYGNCVVIKRKTTWYDRRRVFYLVGHLSEVSVSINDWV